MPALKNTQDKPRDSKVVCYVESELHSWLAENAKERGLTLSAYVAGLLSESHRRLEEPDSDPMAQLAKHMDRMATSLRRLHDDHFFFEEMFAVYVRVYLNHTPAIPECRALEYGKSGSDRFDKFQTYLGQKTGKRSLLSKARELAQASLDETMEADDDRSDTQT